MTLVGVSAGRRLYGTTPPVTFAAPHGVGEVECPSQYAASPGVVSTIGYGPFDGHTWNIELQTVLGGTGTATLELEDDHTLRGEAIISGARFSIELHR